MEKSCQQDIVKCEICFNQLEDPRILPCLHRFCKKCIGLILKFDGDVLQCPLCRKSTKTPPDGADGFPRDFLVSAVLDRVRLRKRLLEGHRDGICGSCEERVEFCAFCLTCDSFICRVCRTLHSKSILRSHKGVIDLHVLESENVLELLLKISSSTGEPKCANHPEQQMYLLCKDCDDRLVCPTCSVMLHTGHDVTILSNIAEELKSKMEEEQENSTKDEDTWRKFLDDIHIGMETIETQRKTLEEKVTEVCRNKMAEMNQNNQQQRQRLFKKQQSRIKVLKEQLAIMEEEFEREVHAYESAMKQQLQCLEESKEEVLRDVRRASDLLLKHYQTVEDRVKGILDRCENTKKTVSVARGEGSGWTVVKAAPQIIGALQDLSREMKEHPADLQNLQGESVILRPSPIAREIGRVDRVPDICEQHERLTNKFCKSCSTYVCNECLSDTCNEHQNDVITTLQRKTEIAQIQENNVTALQILKRKLLQQQFQVDRLSFIASRSSSETLVKSVLARDRVTVPAIHLRATKRDEALRIISAGLQENMEEANSLLFHATSQTVEGSANLSHQEGIQNEIKRVSQRVKKYLGDFRDQKQTISPFYVSPRVSFKSLGDLQCNNMAGINLFSDCILQVFDQRNQSEEVEIRAVSRMAPYTTIMQQSFKCNEDGIDLADPVVTSSVEHVGKDDDYALIFAVGQVVTVVSLEWGLLMCRKEFGVFPIKIKEVYSRNIKAQPDSYISVIQACGNEFFVAFSTSNTILIYNSDFRLQKRVCCNDLVQCISGLAFKNDSFAVIDPGETQVKILFKTGDTTVRQKGALSIENGLSDYTPRSVLRNESYWLVLWYCTEASVSSSNAWMLTLFDDDLHLVKKYFNREKEDIPICIGHWLDEIALAYTDKTFEVKDVRDI